MNLAYQISNGWRCANCGWEEWSATMMLLHLHEAHGHWLDNIRIDGNKIVEKGGRDDALPR